MVDLTLFNVLSLLLPPNGELTQDLVNRRANELRIMDTVLHPSVYDASQPYNLPTEVLPYFFVDHVESLNEEQQLMLLHGGILLMWKDQRIRWNSSEFGNIEEVTMNRAEFKKEFNREIWLPRVHLTEIFLKTANIVSQDSVEVTITYTGHARCKINVLIKTSCYFEYDEYPRDRQNCSFTMYSPFTIEKMKFTKYGGAEKTRYDSRAGTPSKIDVGDFELEKIETRSVFLIPGSKVIDSIKEYPPRMVRSVFWYNLIFRRHNIYFNVRMAIPLFCISVISYLFALSRSPHSLAWMLLSLTVQFMNGMLLVENLPPDYVRMPTIGFIATLVFFETILLILWRIASLLILQTYSNRQDIHAKLEIFEYFLRVYLVVRTLHIYYKLF